MTDRFKELVMDAVCGVGFGSMETAMLCERRGLATYTGNQHNPNWAWNRAALNQMSMQGLQDLYETIKEHQLAEIAAAEERARQPQIVIATNDSAFAQ